MKPMDINSTQFISYRNINVKDLDLFEDAFGFNCGYSDVIDLLRLVNPVPGREMTERLIEKIRKQS
jgi:hypothetical protein